MKLPDRIQPNQKIYSENEFLYEKLYKSNSDESIQKFPADKDFFTTEKNDSENLKRELKNENANKNLGKIYY